MSAQALYDGVTSKYAKHLNPGLTRLMSFAGFGVETVGEGCYIYDHEGRKFLDCLGGYGTFALGHRHPAVVQAVRDQLDRISLSAKAFFSGPSADLAQLLAEESPPGLEFTFFCNSGTEAVEAALKFAKGATGRPGIVSTEGSYHGKTLGALSVTGREKYRSMFEPLLPGVRFVPYGDAVAAKLAIDETVACMIVEPIQGEGGIILPPPGYLRELRDACDASGSLLILDEVQTGMGRTGTMWGCDFDGVSPDLMPIAKALGGGVMPLGAMMGNPAVWEKVYGHNPLVHTSTFGGNPLACAAGIAALKTIREEDLVSRSAKSGELLLSALRESETRHGDMVAEVRGRGLMVGLEFREDEVGELVVAQLLKRGVCVAYALNNPRVLRFEPPLIIDQLQIEFAGEMLDCAIAETKEILADL
jgi:putrescine aminotransferase